MALNSPFQCGGDVKQLPSIPITDRLVIRIDSGSTAKVHISVNAIPSTTVAQFYLNDGETLEIRKPQADDTRRVRILNITGDPLIYWFVR